MASPDGDSGGHAPAEKGVGEREADVLHRLRGAARVWAVASIHAEVDRLITLHDRLYERIEPRDRLVYLGNLIGVGARSPETLDELLGFRRGFLLRPGAEADDVAYLRGAQEEMWRKLLHLQLAPNPAEVLDWMLSRGVGATLAAYGGDVEEARAACRAGVLALTRWTGALRRSVARHAGHGELMMALRRAAYTEDERLLFVHTGLDVTRPLAAQSDSFWWSSSAFEAIDAPYGRFRRIVRGYDPEHGGIAAGRLTASIDAGCGFGGPLVALCITPDGGEADRVEA